MAKKSALKELKLSLEVQQELASMGVAGADAMVAKIQKTIADMENESPNYDVKGLNDGQASLPKTKKKKKEKVNSSYGAPTEAANAKLPDWENPIPDAIPIEVYIEKHAIRYKEQDWLIPERRIEYLFEKVTRPGTAKSLIARINNFTEIEKEAILSGEAKLFQIKTYESIPNELSTLGYALIVKRNNPKRLDAQTYFNAAFLEKRGINTKVLKRKVAKIIQDIRTKGYR